MMNYYDIVFRNVKMSDAECLYNWHIDPLTRESSFHATPVSFENHVEWLAGVIREPDKSILMAELDQMPVGFVRANQSIEGWELSWVVDPGRRGEGIGKNMVRMFVDRVDGILSAKIKKGNLASIRVAEYAGLRLIHEENGFMKYLIKK
jgi:RimJ/RimL family protein N-acetyltransferase